MVGAAAMYIEDHSCALLRDSRGHGFLRRIVEYSTDIAEVVLNLTIERMIVRETSENDTLPFMRRALKPRAVEDTGKRYSLAKLRGG
jgi:hypothetical protein